MTDTNQTKNILLAQAIAMKSIRSFFEQNSFMEVFAPPAVPNPGMEVHIHPFQLFSKSKNELSQLYLHTSPEFYMKWILSQGLEKIFNLSYCFRDEPKSPIHRNQFIMLEWYRANERYEKIIADVEELIKFSLTQFQNNGIETKVKNLQPVKMTVSEVFKKYLDIDILNFLEKNDLKNLIKSKFPSVPLPKEECSWDDYFFLLFLNLIEPEFTKIPFLILTEYPFHLRALSTLKKDDPRVCERFEVYINGIEIANCFNELTDLEEQKKLFKQQKVEKKNLYNYELTEAKVLYRALEKGLPKSSGIALGVERLIMSLTKLNCVFFPEPK